MSPAVIGAICDKILPKVASDAEPTVVWHAGEPTVAPLAWYQNAYDKFRVAAPPSTKFLIQSNGVAISDNWLAFLKETETQIGLSIDGPQRFHDARRKTRTGGGTWTLVMRSLRRLQAIDLYPRVISVLNSSSLSAADEFYEFYRNNDITNVSFSIDEIAGANHASSFDRVDHKDAMIFFLVRILTRAFSERVSLNIREIERISAVLAGNNGAINEQIEPWQIVVVAANGYVTTFSPEFMELTSSFHGNFRFGNILIDSFDDILNSKLLSITHAKIRQGIELCRSNCMYFSVCGGGAPANKMAENGSLVSSESVFCRQSIQASADALLRFLSSNLRLQPADDNQDLSLYRRRASPRKGSNSIQPLIS